jgi:hypothetical protein
VLYPCKRHFRCAQAQHFLVCSWVLIALLRDPGKGTLKGLGTSLPLTLPYGTTLRMVRASQWEAAAVMAQMAAATLRTLPPGGPSRGRCCLPGVRGALWRGAAARAEEYRGAE